MDIREILNNALEDVKNFMERIDDKILDINACPKCHEDRNICPNDFNNKDCNLCDNGSICPNCHEETFKTYLPYFELVNAINANISKFTEKEVQDMLIKELKRINNRKR